MVKVICGIALVDKKMTKDLMQMLDLNETIDELTMANVVVVVVVSSPHQSPRCGV